MDTQTQPLRPSLRRLAYLAFGILVGILGADAFARAVGLTAVSECSGGDREGAIFLRIVLGLVLTATSMIFAAVAVHLVTALTERLAAAPQRPGLAMSIVMMACGSVCVLLSLIFYWWLAAASTIITPRGSESGAIALQSPAGSAGPMAITAGGSVEIRKATSPLTHVVALGTFLAGISMLTLGIWGSMGGRTPQLREPTAPVDNDTGPE